ncbi:hypothetical protein [Taklimakanibacter deserti]|uniref:hypothetical protein n=1 Tax=Taklimakanibacter deserti TaxID=2267839 RepID=UPI000E65886A
MAEPQPQAGGAVAAYKKILSDVIDRRPSGTRQRLAAALGKNRSFVSQITNPTYAVPIPVAHLDIIFEVCHFSLEERRNFISAYLLAHPNRPAPIHAAHKVKAHTVYLPDLGDDDRNARLHTLISDFVRQVAKLLEEEPHKGKRR